MEKRKVAVIGAGISGLSIAHFLKEKNEVVVFEKENRPGGLIKCKNIDANVYHLVGGHVFNSKRLDVLDWFWSFFDKGNEFNKTLRKAVINFDKNLWVNYPIENYLYMLPNEIIKSVINDLLELKEQKKIEYENFEEFLLKNFGKTLYDIYFQPYNEKVWKRNLSDVPLSWLAGKLPMPSVKKIFYNNFCRIEEQSMVHSTFFYPQQNGSQFLADRLAQGLHIKYNQDIIEIKKRDNLWIINDLEFNAVVFSGNIKFLKQMLDSWYLSEDDGIFIDHLESHGTTSVFCEIDKNPYSWIYMPSRNHLSHRIICTGNFPSKCSSDRITATIEFSDFVDIETIKTNLLQIPLNPRYICHHYEKYTYPIQNSDTRERIASIKENLAQENFYLLGRFAEWEYYNMDAAIGAAMDLYKKINI